MRWLLTISILILDFAISTGQEYSEGRDFPKYIPAQEAQLKSSVKLPAKVNLAKSKYFPNIFEQFGWSCNQSSSIGYLLTYELNRIRNADGGLPENRYSPLFVWNFLNSANYGTGVSYFDSWEIIKSGGSPNEVDYPNTSDLKYWMSGYDRYYRAMQNRVVKNWSLPVGTPADLQVLKRYLYDHFDGSKFGGMANFQIASGGMNLSRLPSNSYDEGASYITTFGTFVGHALTVVGYNDSIRLDRNGDGEYTNTIDIDGDHVVDLNDFEKGALIVANTWGKGWGDSGFAYVPYHLLGLYGKQGGLWNKSVHIVETAKTVEPILTLRTEFSHSSRKSLRIMAGVSNDPDATEPEHILEFPMFHYQGTATPFYSHDGGDTTRFELGLDISPLTDFIETDGPVRIFLIFDEKDAWSGIDGKIYSMSVYNQFNSKDSTLCSQTQVTVNSNSRTLMSVVRPVRFNRIKIREVPKLVAKPGDYVSLQMEVEGAASPYIWELLADYRIGFARAAVPDWGGSVLYNGQSGNPVSRVELPFKFRFFGKEYDHFSITEDAEVLFDQEVDAYPYAIDPGLVFQSIKQITGFGTDLDYYMENNTISVFTNDSLMAITWQAVAPTDEGGVPVKIVGEFHPDGRIRFIYDQPEKLFPGGTIKDLGVSYGDNRQLRKVSQFNTEKLVGVNSLVFNPYQYTKETKFDETGWLFCRPETNNTLYEIKVRVVDRNNRMSYSTVQISTQNLDSVQLLSENFPNPFNETTRFRIIVPQKSEVLAEIFDIRGAKVAVLCEGEFIPAEYEFSWNGTNSIGSRVGPGIYFCRLKIGDRIETRKLLKSN